MTSPREHTARQASLAAFVSFKRLHPADWADGVHAVFGKRSDGKSWIQSISFDSDAWTESASRAWLKERGFTVSGFIPASKVRQPAAVSDPVRFEVHGTAEDGDGKTVKIRMDVVKADAFKKQIFGWLYVSNDCTGKQVVDHSGETVSIQTLEPASYKYVASHRKMGDMHGRTKDGQVVESGHLIECVVFTPEKREAMAVSLGHKPDALTGLLPDAMWVGYQVTNDATFADVLNGTKRSLSFGGRARKIPVAE